jgi:hypothetical protein
MSDILVLDKSKNLKQRAKQELEAVNCKSLIKEASAGACHPF